MRYRYVIDHYIPNEWVRIDHFRVDSNGSRIPDTTRSVVYSGRKQFRMFWDAYDNREHTNPQRVLKRLFELRTVLKDGGY